MVLHHNDNTFVSAGADNIWAWKLPEGQQMWKMPGHNTTINTLALNLDNVLVSGGDDGSLYFWDYKSGKNFQKI